MTINFQPDFCAPRDPAAFGQWLTGHYYEHQVFRKKCLTLTPKIIVTDYDILGWRDEPKLVQQWLVAHESIHQTLRAVCNVTGADLSLVDFSDNDQFNEWMGDHASEHQIFRSVLGIS